MAGEVARAACEIGINDDPKPYEAMVMTAFDILAEHGVYEPTTDEIDATSQIIYHASKLRRAGW